MNKNILILVVILAILGGVYLLASKGEPEDVVDTNQSPITSGENPQPGSQVHDLPVEPAAARARQDLAARLSVEEKSIVIIQITETTWTDSCLGLGQANESCLQALVPGFKVEMLAKGGTYFYRTDQTGATVRAETQ